MTTEKTNNDESTKAQAAFIQYCSLGPDRSLAKLADLLDKKPGYVRQLESWSSAYSWVKRAREYDAGILQKEANERERKRQEERDKMNARQTKIGTTQQANAIGRIQQLINDDKFGALASVQLLKVATDIERKAREEPDQKIELTGKDGGPIIIKTSWGTPKVERNKE